MTLRASAPRRDTAPMTMRRASYTPSRHGSPPAILPSSHASMTISREAFIDFRASRAARDDDTMRISCSPRHISARYAASRCAMAARSYARSQVRIRPGRAGEIIAEEAYRRTRRALSLGIALLAQRYRPPPPRICLIRQAISLAYSMHARRQYPLRHGARPGFSPA